MSPNPNGIGVALSGGGYRATAFHLGTLKKLNELGVLSRVDVLSTISGGSITGACYCTREGSFDGFYNHLYAGLQTKNVVRRVLFSWLGLRMLMLALIVLGSIYFLFTPRGWIFLLILIVILFLIFKFQFYLLPISKRIEEIYDQFFYKNKTLNQLCENPVIVIGSTNLQTGRPFSFSRNFMGDSTYTYREPSIRFLPAQFPISRAVMASSCVPFAFTPIRINKEYFANEPDAEKVHPVLVDGGVYDNQGIHKVMQKGKYACPFVITSDAGSGPSGEMTFKNTFQLLLETVNVFMSRIKRAQMVMDVYENAGNANKEIAYLSLGWDVENCIPGFINNLEKGQIVTAVIEAHKLKPEWIAEPAKFRTEIQEFLEQRIQYKNIDRPSAEEKHIARAVSTNLTSLSKKQVDCLVKQAEALTEVQVKLYCPSILI